MTQLTPTPSPSALTERIPTTDQTLRRLFLTLFLRGHSSRGLQKKTVPKSIGQKLTLTLFFYTLLGLLAGIFYKQPIFALSVYLHAMTFTFLGMFVASSAGEILFNKEEADILLHRPITPRSLLWAKVRVLVEVSLWIAAAFNLAGFVVGFLSSGNDWRFPIVHAISTVLEALFCTGCVVMVYQLCLRWFGRERLEGLMTMTQVLVSIAAVMSGQLLPRMVINADKIITFSQRSWWIALPPPAWFAGLDDALAGSGAKSSWLLAALAIVGTAAVLWAAFGKLAHDYEVGLQNLGESAPRRMPRGKRRSWIDAMVDSPPLRWWLRDPVARASFLLTTAYLFRDRDTKLRVYPGIAPFLALPLIFSMQGLKNTHGAPDFSVAFVGAYLGLIPLLGMNLLQYSQQWQASDIVRSAPIAGPAQLCHGARRAVLCFLTLPIVIVFALILWLPHHNTAALLMMLPGVIALPVFALIPTLGGAGIPLSLPNENAKSAGRGLTMMAAMLSSIAISGIALWSSAAGWFWWFILGETILAIGFYFFFRLRMSHADWPSLE